jgi:predicted SAM-dependent methyltransferase
MTTPRRSDFDMSELRENLHDCNTLYNAVGTLNPRNPGLHNKLIQFAKRLIQRSLSWYTRPLHQFQAAVTRCLNELTKAAENSEQVVTAWRQNIPAFLNAVSTVSAFGHELRNLRRDLEQTHQEAEQRLHSLREQMRRELEQELQSAQQQTRQEAEQGHQEIRKELDEALASVRGGLGQTDASVAAIWERIEFTRSEMLYEMRYGKHTADASAVYAELNHVEPRIISLKKVAAARRSGLKLNLGCGHIPLEGYVNVDRRELPGIDVVADVAELPFEEGEVQEISSAHLLEHFPQEMLRRRLLPTWRSLLAPGGIFRAVVPDGEAMLAGIAAGNYRFSDFREVLFGAQDYEGDFHFNLFTPDTLCALLEEAGFAEINIKERARINGKCFEFEVSAVKPPLRVVSDKSSESDTKEACAEAPPSSGRL